MSTSSSTLGRAGLIAAGLHVGLVLYFVLCILFAGESDWPMYWLVMIAVDATIASLWFLSLLLNVLLRRSSVGTVMLTQLATWIEAPADHGRAISRWLRTSIAILVIATPLALAGAAYSMGTLGRAMNIANFVFPVAVFGIAGSWMCGSLIVNVVRVVTPSPEVPAPPRLPRQG